MSEAVAAAARYAIFEDGGKQYRAEEGALVRVDLKQVEPGAELTFDKVLLVGNKSPATAESDTPATVGRPSVGQPTVEGASVVAVVECEEKGPKVRGLRRRFRDRSKTAWGHRQKYTLVRVTKIVEAGD